MLLSHLHISVSNTVVVLVIDSMCLCDNICCHSVWLSRLFSFLSSTRLTILRFVFLGTLCVAISYALQYKASYDHVAHFFLEKPSTSMFLYFHSFKIISAHWRRTWKFLVNWLSCCETWYLFAFLFVSRFSQSDSHFNTRVVVEWHTVISSSKRLCPTSHLNP